MKALVSAATLPFDSLMMKKKDNLQQQLFSQPWYARVQELANALWWSMSTAAAAAAAAAEALVDLQAPPTTATTTPVCWQI
jgi:hypothetical protein